MASFLPLSDLLLLLFVSVLPLLLLGFGSPEVVRGAVSGRLKEEPGGGLWPATVVGRSLARIGRPMGLLREERICLSSGQWRCGRGWGETAWCAAVRVREILVRGCRCCVENGRPIYDWGRRCGGRSCCGGRRCWLLRMKKKGKPAWRRSGRERGGDDGFEMAGLQGEKKSKKMGNFCFLVLFWPREGQSLASECVWEKKIKEDGRRLCWRRRWETAGSTKNPRGRGGSVWEGLG